MADMPPLITMPPSAVACDFTVAQVGFIEGSSIYYVTAWGGRVVKQMMTPDDGDGEGSRLKVAL